MKSLFLAAGMMAFLAVGAAQAQTSPAPNCETQAATKKLSGAAKNSFVKKCKADACEGKAVGSNGKPLVGAAKASFMKKCEQGA
jgi:hypothetical protein